MRSPSAQSLIALKSLILAATVLVTSSATLTASAASGSGSIEGVWRLSAPQTLLAPAGGAALPLTDEGRQRYEAHRKAAAGGDHRFDPTLTGCASPGQPRLMLTPKLFAIVRRPSMVTIVYEWNRLIRQISVGTRLRNPLLPENFTDFPTSQGYADGHWEGDALVVQTKGLADTKLLDALLPNSDQLELTERIRLVNANTLEDRITIKDPVMFSAPWESVVRYTRQPDSLFPFLEDVCLDRLKSGAPPL